MPVFIGELLKDGVVIAKGVEFSLATQEINGHKTTSGSLKLPTSLKININYADPMFDIELKDGRKGRIAFNGRRVADGAFQYFEIKALGL